MRHRRPFIAAVVLWSLCFLLVGARGVPSTAELRQMVNDKQHKRVLREVARAMQLKGDDATPYDRSELLLIRGDAQLAMRIEPAAAKSYREAAEAAMSADHRATARAMTLLMSKCEQLQYKPHTGDAGREIDIVKDRQAALDALLTDEMAAAEPKVRAANESKQIADVLAAAKVVEPLASIERAATGATTRTNEISEAFVLRIETLLDEALIEMDGKANDIEQRALGLIAVPQEVRPEQAPTTTIKTKKRGLSPADETALKGIMNVCSEIVSRRSDVALQLGAEPNRFRPASDFAIRLSSKAGAILRADYTGIRERPIDATGTPPPSEPTERRGTLPG